MILKKVILLIIPSILFFLAVTQLEGKHVHREPPKTDVTRKPATAKPETVKHFFNNGPHHHHDYFGYGFPYTGWGYPYYDYYNYDLFNWYDWYGYGYDWWYPNYYWPNWGWNWGYNWGWDWDWGYGPGPGAPGRPNRPSGGNNRPNGPGGNGGNNGYPMPNPNVRAIDIQVLMDEIRKCNNIISTDYIGDDQKKEFEKCNQKLEEMYLLDMEPIETLQCKLVTANHIYRVTQFISKKEEQKRRKESKLKKLQNNNNDYSDEILELKEEIEDLKAEIEDAGEEKRALEEDILACDQINEPIIVTTTTATPSARKR
uniref:Uncharacterized protein n=1 Tax=Parastrongyloides trichosuri TaxID=131310 RepID=A0A0N4ZKW2_PARTI